jgi:phosphatidylglycerol lysyltransferase
VIATLATSSLPMSSGTPQHWIAAIVLTLSALYLPLYFVLTTRRALMRWLPADVGVPPLQLKIQLTLISFVDWVLAAATLYACIYLSGEHVKPACCSALSPAPACSGWSARYPAASACSMA